MNKIYLLIAIVLIVVACNSNKRSSEEKDSPRKEILDIAVKYTMEKLSKPKKIIESSGIITISDNRTNFVSKSVNQKYFVIDPAKILTGFINDDKNEDAIITLPLYNGQYIESTELLILIYSDNKFKITKVLEGDMKVLKIEDREIYIEIPELPSDSPNYNCAICREVVKYKYINGDLIRTE